MQLKWAQQVVGRKDVERTGTNIKGMHTVVFLLDGLLNCKIFYMVFSMNIVFESFSLYQKTT